jgi:hypothetical protein
MKATFFKSVLFLALAAGTFVGCVNDDDYQTPSLECTETSLVKNFEVSQVPASSTLTQFTEDKIIEAYVTSSDEGGNFFKTISFQTLPTEANPQPRGFSVPVDATSTFISFDPGRKVFIKLQNLYTDVSNGGIRIGAIFVNSSGVASVGRMPESQLRTALVRSCVVVDEDQLARTLTIQEAKSDANLNTLIDLENVQFADDAINTTYYDAADDLGGATNHNLVDAEGNSVIFRTSSFANFASRPVADGRGTVRGVMTKFGADYQFMARTERDIQLDGPRLTPLFAENFESITTVGNNQFIALPGWTNVTMNGGTEKWEARSFSNNKYAQFSAFGTSETNVDARLITPGINLANTTDEFLRFGSKIGFANGEAVTVWVSNDYDGSGTVAAVNAATWTQLDATFAPQSQTYPENFTGSGQVDLSALEGTVYISFRYVGSSTGVTSTYQIDNIEVYGN